MTTIPRPIAFSEVAHGLDRLLWARLVEWGRPYELTIDGEPAVEWYTNGSLWMNRDAVPFSVGHVAQGGTVVGEVLRLTGNAVAGNAAMWVAAGTAGDAVLDAVGYPSSLDPELVPVSIAFLPTKGGTVEYPPIKGVRQLQRNRVEVVEVAVVPRPALTGAHIYARTTMTALNQLGVSK